MARREPWQPQVDGSDGLLTTVRETLEQRGLRCVPYDECSLRAWIRRDKATYELFVSVDDERESAVFYLLFPTHALAPRRPAVAELCTRVNWYIKIGNLEMDFSDGDVRFRATVDVEDSMLTAAMIDNIVRAGLWTLDTYHDALVRVIVDSAEPAQAFADVLEQM